MPGDDGAEGGDGFVFAERAEGLWEGGGAGGAGGVVAQDAGSFVVLLHVAAARGDAGADPVVAVV